MHDVNIYVIFISAITFFAFLFGLSTKIQWQIHMYK
jgi:hypothetical protein